MKKIPFYLILVQFCVFPVLGQTLESGQVLTLENAIDFAVSNNKQLKIQRNLVQIAENNVFKGNAGLMPSVRLASDAKISENNAAIDIRTFVEQPPLVRLDETGVQSSTLTSGVRADYVLVGGFGGKYRYKLLENDRSIAKYQQEVVWNELILGISTLYLDIAKLQSREELLIETVEISREQLQRIESQIEFGQATGTIALAAKTQINQELDALDNVRLLRNTLIKELNFLMGTEPETTYQVAVSFTDPVVLEIQELKAKVMENNPELKINSEFVGVSTHQLKVQESQKYPRLNAFADYGYFRQENQVQQLAKIETLGYSAGLSLSFTIFDGKRVNQGIRNAKIGVENSETRLTLIGDELVKEAVKEQSQLLLLKTKLGRQENDLATFEDNFRRTQDRFERGLASSLDLREAQRSLFNARVGITDSKLDILQSVYRIRNLTGEFLTILE